MLKRKNSMLGIDIGSSSIKCIELTAIRNKLVITGYGQVPVIDNDTESQQEALIDLVRQYNLKNRRVVTAVSGREVIVRYITITPVEKENLPTAVRFEADKYIPYDLDEVVLDSQQLDDQHINHLGNDSGDMKVLLVAAKRSLIEQRVNMLKAASLKSVVIDVDSFALGNTFELRRIFSAQPESDGKVVALIDIGATKTNINILIGNTSFFTREIYLAGKEFTEEVQRRLEIDEAQAEALKRSPGEYHVDVQETITPVVDDLANEINLSFDYFESQFEREVEELYLSGGGSQLFSLDEDFERNFGKKITRWDPTEVFDVRGNVDREQLSNNAPQLAVAIGLASRIIDFNTKIIRGR